jgi:hypothetical protein
VNTAATGWLPTAFAPAVTLSATVAAAQSVVTCALSLNSSAYPLSSCAAPGLLSATGAFAPSSTAPAIDLWAMYVGAAAFPSPALAYSSVLLVNVTLPRPFGNGSLAPAQSATDAAFRAAAAAGALTPTALRAAGVSALPSPADFTNARSPWAPLLAMAAALPAPIATFTVDALSCLPPTCYFSCFTIALSNMSAMSSADFSNLLATASMATPTTDANVAAALTRRLQWQRVPTNVTMVNAGNCRFRAIVQCELPLFSTATSGVSFAPPRPSTLTTTTYTRAYANAWAWLRGALQPQTHTAAVVLSTPIPPAFLFGYTPPVAAVAPAPTDLATSYTVALLGAGAGLMLAIGAYLLWRYKRVPADFDPKALLYPEDDEDDKDKVAAASASSKSTGGADSLQTESGVRLRKRRVRKRDREIRALLASMPADELENLDADALRAGLVNPDGSSAMGRGGASDNEDDSDEWEDEDDEDDDQYATVNAKQGLEMSKLSATLADEVALAAGDGADGLASALAGGKSASASSATAAGSTISPKAPLPGAQRFARALFGNGRVLLPPLPPPARQNTNSSVAGGAAASAAAGNEPRFAELNLSMESSSDEDEEEDEDDFAVDGQTPKPKRGGKVLLMTSAAAAMLAASLDDEDGLAAGTLPSATERPRAPGAATAAAAAAAKAAVAKLAQPPSELDFSFDVSAL